MQGVGFRNSLVAAADELACFGWCKNTRKGTVVGEARCSKLAGPRLKEWLKKGPVSARVERVEAKVYEDTKIRFHFSDFAVLDESRSTCFEDGPPHQCSEGELEEEVEPYSPDL